MSSSILVVSLGFSMYNIMLSLNSDTFPFPFQFRYPSFIYFCLIPVAMTSKSMLNKSGKSGHHCLIPDLRDSLNICYNTFCRIIDFSNYVAVYFFLKKCIFGKSHLDHTTGFKTFKKINPFLILIPCHDKHLTLRSLIVMKVVTKF